MCNPRAAWLVIAPFLVQLALMPVVLVGDRWAFIVGPTEARAMLTEADRDPVGPVVADDLIARAVSRPTGRPETDATKSASAFARPSSTQPRHVDARRGDQFQIDPALRPPEHSPVGDV